MTARTCPSTLPFAIKMRHQIPATDVMNIMPLFLSDRRKVIASTAIDPRQIVQSDLVKAFSDAAMNLIILQERSF